MLRQHYAGYELRDCWPSHIHAVWELSTLAAAWHHAYGGQRPDLARALEFYDRWLPGTMRRIAAITRVACPTAPPAAARTSGHRRAMVAHRRVPCPRTRRRRNHRKYRRPRFRSLPPGPGRIPGMELGDVVFAGNQDPAVSVGTRAHGRLDALARAWASAAAARTWPDRSTPASPWLPRTAGAAAQAGEVVWALVI